MEEKLWELTNCYFERRAYESAAFYADKLVSLSGKSNIEHVYLLASCFYHNHEYPRVTHLLEKYGILHHSAKTQVLAGQAMIAAKEYQGCVRILSEQPMNDSDEHWQAMKYFLLGQAHEARESNHIAADQYKLALKSDPSLLEAFNALIDHQLLTADEELQLIVELNGNEPWLNEFYMTRIKKCIPSGNELNKLQFNESIDVLLSVANRLYSNHKIDQAYEISAKVLREDPFNLSAVPLHCGCMQALGEVGELYNLAHNLVKDYSDSPAAWYAAGMYYYTIKKYEYARKFFIKAYKINKDYLPAWISYGHTYAAQDQSDQAMRAYRTVSRLFPGCHLSNLYMGMEYLRTKNLRTALLSLELAKQINAEDPVVWNEIGVVLYKRQEYAKANEVFSQALRLCEGALQSTCETVLFNLAHTYQKLHNFGKAIEYYKNCIQLNSRCASTYTAIGLTYYLNNQIQEAVDAFNKALFLKSNDRFTNDLLYIALFECCDDLPMQEDSAFEAPYII